MRGERRRMLSLHGKGVLVGEVVGTESVGIETVELGSWRRLSSVQAAFRGG